MAAPLTTQIAPLVSSGVEVYGDVTMKTVSREDQSQKKNSTGQAGWVISILRQNGRLVDEMRITVWGDRPQVTDGDKIVFTGLTVGAYAQGSNANTYFHATGVKQVSAPSAAKA